MLDVEQLAQKDRPSSFAQWAYDAIGQPGVCLRVRLRGNNLHILCESRQSLEAQTIVNCLIDALKVQEGEDAFPSDPGNPVDQIVIYGRIVGQPRPEWIKQIRIKSHPNPEHQASRTATVNSFADATPDEALLISNESLARSGSPEAIARYLSEILSPLGVSAKVLIQILPQASANAKEGENLTASSPHRRLWVVCNSNYSPDASLLCEPVVEQLRNLQLKGFRDAAICSQVSGETSPEWMLRVDLTPPEEMLKDWARWGDVQALTRILNQRLKRSGIEVRAILKDVTLHLFCNQLAVKGPAAPDKQTAVNAIASGLESISPQGIQAATVYGVEAHQRPRRELIPEQETPIWIEWINLPAAGTPALAESAFSLAQQGNQEAITFLLQRLINPDLERRLATGGIHLKIRRKQDLLHIMSEAPLCPPQAQVGPPIARFLRQMGIPEIAGVRIYGRRAGATSPSWNYGVDFIHRPRLVPEATPEFAASDTYINELTAPTGEPVLRRDLTKEDLKNGLKRTTQAIVRTLQLCLCYSQLFVPAVESQDLRTLTGGSNPKSFSSTQGVKVAIVWGALGLLLTVQADWLMGRLIRLQAQSNSVLPTATTTDASPKPLDLPQLSLQKGGSQRTGDFNASGFTRQGEKSVIINENTNQSSTSTRGNAAIAAILAARSPNPSFNNQLLDQKLALYQQRLLKSGPPDILILGSSRALRGIDPVALQDALAAQGYRNIEVFNFGINGATAQVVDLLIRRILAPEQLPKLIIWADGARAFNSGRVDATYDAIASSKAYQQLQAGTFSNSVNVKQRDGNRRPGEASQPTPSADKIPQALAAVNAASQSIGQWLDRSLGNVSLTYHQRDQLKSLLREQYVTLLERAKLPQDPTLADSQKSSTAQESIDIAGFLPLSVRFNPASYYKQHPRVPGDYDNDYESFQLGGKQDIALGSLLQYAKSQNIGIVFINLPLTKDYLDPVRTEYEQQFQRYMRSWSLQKGLLFRDLSELLLTKHDYFSDPSHLNRYGAYQVSNQLAQDPMIPWPTK